MNEFGLKNREVDATKDSASKVAHTDMDTATAVDRGLQKEKQQRREASFIFYEAGQTKDNTLGRNRGNAFLDHKQRDFRVGADAFNADYETLGRAGRRFAFTDAVADKIIYNTDISLKDSDLKDKPAESRIQDSLKSYGIADVEHLFPETAEAPTSRLFTEPETISNYGIVQR